MKTVHKTLIIGGIKKQQVIVTVTIEKREKGLVLHINGDIGKESGGQIILGFKEYDERGYYSINDIVPAKNWTTEKIKQLFDVWKKHHANNLNPGCVHQDGWETKKIDESKPLSDYGKHIPDQGASWNMLTWVTPEKHPEGLLTKACPVCGYKYGTSWLFRELPKEIIDYIVAL
jgi:hypothetical protein